MQKAQKSFMTNSKDKDAWLTQWQSLLEEYPMIKAIVYFNLDSTEGMSKQVGGQAEWSMILSPYRADYTQGVHLLTTYASTRALDRLFRIKKK